MTSEATSEVNFVFFILKYILYIGKLCCILPLLMTFGLEEMKMAKRTTYRPDGYAAGKNVYRV